MKPGYYYARWAKDKNSDPFEIIRIDEEIDKLGRQVVYIFGSSDDFRLGDFKDIRGPLDPNKMFSPSASIQK